jgi:murein DD-endopeptidase MepM/ murein hydrolase activator NlpD
MLLVAVALACTTARPLPSSAAVWGTERGALLVTLQGPNGAARLGLDLLDALPPDALPIDTLPVASWPVVGGWQLPVQGVVSSAFGPRWGRHHDGMDLAAPTGAPVHAARPGTVRRAGEMGGLGLAVELEHAGGWMSRYGHLSVVHVRPGEGVNAAAVLGEVGETGNATGPHLHWEIWHDGVPVDPASLLASGRTP